VNTSYQNIASNVRQLVGNDQLEEACQLLIALPSPFKDKGYEQISRLRGLESKYIDGLLSVEAYNREKNAIRKAILVHANDLSITEKSSLEGETSPIKGLHAFEYTDAPIFRQLQREEEIRYFGEAVLNKAFVIGMLTGVSGSGKTSFLKAGLQPKLEESGIDVIYVKFSDTPPLISIIQAIEKQAQLKIPSKSTFVEVVAKVAPLTKPTLLVFDQFEQFFTHFRTEKERSIFIDDLSQWYKVHEKYGLKLLFSVRSDMQYFLNEIQEHLEYQITPRINLFVLKKFTAQQATAIFKVIANANRVPFDESFVENMCTNELIAKEDGLISAVDIQILSMMLNSQQSKEDRAFNQKAYEKFGGIEGLLQRFVKEQLDAPSIHNKDQAALKVLLALTDLDRNVRAGSQSLKQLSLKLQHVVKASLLPGILDWLCAVRLVTEITRNNQLPVYELAHERLIIPLRNIAGKTLTKIDNCSHLLDRRVNEWLGNQKDRRYLFNLRELLLIRKYEKLVRWEPKREQKELLIKASWKKWRKRGITWSSLAIVLLIGWFAFNTQYGIIQRIKYRDIPLSIEKAAPESQKKAAGYLCFAYPDLALNIVERINWEETAYETAILLLDSLNKDSVPLSLPIQLDLLDVRHKYHYDYYDKLSEKVTNVVRRNGALELLLKWEEIALAMPIYDLDKKLPVLANLAEEAMLLGEEAKARDLLSKAENAIDEKYKDDEYFDELDRIKYYSIIAVRADRIGFPKKASDLLSKAEVIAEQIKNPQDQILAYATLIKAFTNLKRIDISLEFISKGERILELQNDIQWSSALFESIGHGVSCTGSPELLTRGKALIKKTKNNYYYSSLAKSAANAMVHSYSAELLSESLELTKKIEFNDYRSEVLLLLLRNLAKAGELDAIVSLSLVAEKIYVGGDKRDQHSYFLSTLAKDAAQMADSTVSVELLLEAEKLAERVKDAYKDDVYIALMKSASSIARATNSAALIKKAELFSQDIGYIYGDDKLKVWLPLIESTISVAKATHSLELLSKADTFIRKIDYYDFSNESTKAYLSIIEGMVSIAITTNSLQPLSKAKEFLEGIDLNHEELSKARVMIIKGRASLAETANSLQMLLQTEEFLNEEIVRDYHQIEAFSILAESAAQLNQDSLSLDYLERGYVKRIYLKNLDDKTRCMLILSNSAANIAAITGSVRFIEMGANILLEDVYEPADRVEALLKLTQVAMQIGNLKKACEIVHLLPEAYYLEGYAIILYEYARLKKKNE
jgi:hypothetical protein